MTEHAQVVWGYAGAETLARINGQQPGWRTRRQFPIAPSEAGDNATIRPYTFPWLASADAFGVSYPAGTLAVVQSMSLPFPLASTLNADFESQWSSFATTVYAVPGVLPVGYTASLYDGWHSSDANLARRRTASGYVDATWLPSSSPNGETVGPVTLVGSGGAIGDPPGYMVWASAKTGYRKVQYRLRTGMQWLAMPSYTQTMTLTHNANGTNPGSARGDTIDAISTVTNADFSDPDGDFWWETGWKDLGQIIASSIGTLTTFNVETDSSANLASMPNGVTVQWRLSPRCDVPFPLSVHGYGDLIAPGGYP